MIAIVLATRGRPALLAETIERTLPNIACNDTTLTVIVDDDDSKTLDVASQLPSHKQLFYRVVPRADTLGEKFNLILDRPATVYLYMVDHSPIITPAFDKKYLEANIFPDGIGCIFNRLENPSFSQTYAVTKGLVDRMGYLFPPYFPYWFVDHWLDDIARMIDRWTVVDVELDSRKRPGTQDRREPAFWATFYDAMYSERLACAHRIIDGFGEPQWRKDMLKSRCDYHNQRSVMINNTVRRIQWAPEPFDERYLRVRARAVAMLKDMLKEADVQSRCERSSRAI